MNAKILSGALLFMGFCVVCVGANIRKSSSQEFKEIVNSSFNSHYEETTCNDIYIGRRRSGINCVSGDKKLLRDFGVSVANEQMDLPIASDNEVINIASGSTTYTVSMQRVGGHKFYIAEIDCDEEGAAIYRPTSTCLVAINFQKGKFSYIQVTLVDNVAGVVVAKKNDVLDFIDSLTQRADMPPKI